VTVHKYTAIASGNGTFSATLNGAGSNRLICVLCASTAGGSKTLSTLDMNGETGLKLLEFSSSSGQYLNAAIYVFTDAQHPGNVLATFTPSWTAAAKAAYIIIESTDGVQSPPFINEVTTPTFHEDVETQALSSTLVNSAGQLGIFAALAGDGSYFAATLNTISANLESEAATDNTDENCWISCFHDPVIGSASEVYTANYDNGRAGVATDNVTSIAFSINAPEVNIDPVLDTPQPDVSIQEGQTGTIAAGGNFSDGNGDTLTFSINPNINAVTGFTFNTSTGAIIYDGSQIAANAISYTVTATDGNGGTDATDIFDITVTPPQFRVDPPATLTPEAGAPLIIPVGNESAPVTALCSAGVLTGSYSSGQFILDVPVPPDFGDQTLLFESNVVITFSDGTNTDTLTIQIQVPSGELFAEITAIDVDGIYANDAGLAVGDFAHFKGITGDIVIDPATGLVSINPSTNITYSYSLYDISDNGGIWSEQYSDYSSTAEIEPPVIVLNGADPLVWVQGIAWSDPGATVTDNVDATRQINADNVPDINTVGPYILNYNASDAAGNAATLVTRTVNVASADVTPDQFSYVDVNNAELNTLYENIQPVVGIDAGQTVTASGVQVSNDNGVSWSNSVQMITGQTLSKASLTTSDTNSLEHTVTGTINGMVDTFSVTTKAQVTLAFSIGSSDPLVYANQSLVNYTFPVWGLWDRSPEEGGVLIDSGVNLVIANGTGSIQTSSAQAGVDYLLIPRDPGDLPAHYMRSKGQVA